MLTFHNELNKPESPKQCGCYNCMSHVRGEHGFPMVLSQMILCPECGNKRCPKATDHNNECTNSNESGQIGSRY